MFISNFSIDNYKSFYKSGNIYLTPGFNIITGQNSAGKTALLEALALKFINNPHRTSKTVPTVESTVNGYSLAQIGFTLTRNEIEDFLFHNSQIVMPLIKDFPAVQLENENFMPGYFDELNIIRASFSNGNLYDSYFALKRVVDSNKSYFFLNNDGGRITIQRSGPKTQDASIQIVQKLIERIYFFKAERLKIGTATLGTNKILNSDASNLPEVLNILQGDPVRFQKYNSYVRQIFPHVHLVTTRPIGQQTVEIMVWNEDPNLMRSDLSISLSECGTGISQVLAILYVILTSDIPRTIIIDEPNSFLHPGAARKLIEILKAHTQHQFIISTHSPSTLAASNPQTVHIVRIRKAESFVESVSINESKNQQLYLAEIGAKLSDVFGSDNILWVEGKTEELCFPKIVERMSDTFMKGTSIIAVMATGDFQKKNKTKFIFDVYSRLSKSNGLIPAAIGFMFDGEELTDQQKEDLSNETSNKVLFLKRRAFENYLLNMSGIHFVISNIEELKDQNIQLTTIQDWISKNKWDKKYIKTKYSNSQSEDLWLVNVDAPKLLSDLFWSVSNGKLSFDKITHSVPMCEWIIDNSFDDLAEVKEMLASVLTTKL